MPIRFRCDHCHQLLGIARRKSGTSVNCPSCQRAVLVPGEDDDSLQMPAHEPDPALFERDDFEAMLRPPPSLVADAPPRPYVPAPRPAPDYSPQGPSYQSEVPVVGLVLSPARATVLTVVVILLLALAFGGGLLVGRFYL